MGSPAVSISASMAATYSTVCTGCPGPNLEQGGTTNVVARRDPRQDPPAFVTVVPSRTIATASPRRRGATSWRRHGAAGRR